MNRVTLAPMTTTLIVTVHPNPNSFTAAWARASEAASRALGHKVLTSDLYAQRFDPAEGPAHYGSTPPFDALKAQEHAARTGTLPPDIAAEVAKVRAADRLIFHFPLWWFAPPAMLKGWFDRALAHHALHDVDNRFDTGPCRGKRALFCVTTGANAAESAPDGKEGNTRLLLWPAAQTLRYTGMTLLDPVLVHGVHGYNRDDRKTALETRLKTTLSAQADLIARFDTLPQMPFNADTDFDATGRLKPVAPSVTPFIRHPD